MQPTPQGERNAQLRAPQADHVNDNHEYDVLRGFELPAPPPETIIELERYRDIRRGAGPQWVVKGLVPANGLTVVYGDAGTGKSFLALHISLMVALGDPAFGHACRQGGVLYIACEGAQGFRARIEAFKLANQDAQPDLPFALIGREVRLRGQENDLSAVDHVIGEARALFREMGQHLTLVVIDTLARAGNGADENASEDMGQLIQAFGHLGAQAGAAVMVVHHSGKNPAMGARGHSSLRGAADAMLEVRKATEGGQGSTVTIAKMKDADDSARHAFMLEVVSLGTDNDGDAITSCILRELGDAPKAEKQPSRDEEIVLDAIAEAVERMGVDAEEAFGGEPEFIVARRADVKAIAERLGFHATGSPGARNTAYLRAVKSLKASGRVAEHSISNRTGYLWLTPS